MVKIDQAMASVRAFFADQLGLEAKVVAARPQGDGWQVTVEAIVEDEYMRQRARRDLVGTFDVFVDAKLQIVSFERKELRERGTITG